jgi:DNA-binding NarL/FixJ family response regulator
MREGSGALERGEWASARACFAAALEAGDSPEAIDGLGLALWYLGSVAEGIAARERAFEEFARARRCDDAARVAVWVSHQHMVGGRASAARGWLARAERLLEGIGDCAGHGWVAVERARHAEHVSEQAAHARRAIEIARATGADELEVFALSMLGRAEMSAHRESGMRLLEEAMVAAAAGRVRTVNVLAEAYCNLIIACTSAGEWERATEWCEIVDEFARDYAATPLLGACRAIHADVLIATGHWSEAEKSLDTALATHARYVPEVGAPAVASLAELRVQQGRLADAEELLGGREEHPPALRALALLRIAEQRPEVAVELLRRGLRSTVDDAVRATQLLAPLVDARLACGALEEARENAEQLAQLAHDSGIRLVAARAKLAAAHVALADSAVDEAADCARQALAAFSILSMPLDAGEARLTLAQALAGDSPEVAAEEARTACAAFRDLGASRAMDRAASILRDLGAGTGGRPRGGGDLTAREREVLELITLGMTNARIAQTLVISEKTAGHHVSRILTKLGVHNRTEAALHARSAG